MAQTKLKVLRHTIAPPMSGPAPVLPLPAPHDWLPSKWKYAIIHCECEDDVDLYLNYLRPDMHWPFDPLNPIENTYDETKKVAVAYLKSHDFEQHQRWLTGNRKVFALIDYSHPQAHRLHAEGRRLFLHFDKDLEPPPNIDAWLWEHPLIASNIRWAEPGQAHSNWYGIWDEDLKASLIEAFEAAWAGNPIQPPDPPTNVGNFDQSTAVGISRNDAWEIYRAHVAHSLLLELKNALPWSLTEYEDDARLQIILNAREIIGLWNSGGFNCDGYVLHSAVMPAPPHEVMDFLRLNHLIGESRLRTIGRVLEWCRDNLSHFVGSIDRPTTEKFWAYPIPTLSGMLAGTVYSEDPNLGLRHWTAGCHGTAYFLKALLRVINIPAKSATAAAHSGVNFLSENKFLVHGDDPYTSMAKCTPTFPGEELLIDEVAFTRWFVDEEVIERQKENLERRVAELAIKYLSNELLHSRYLDFIEGEDISTSSRVYKLFTTDYMSETLHLYDLETLREGFITASDGSLIQSDLWKRLDEKIVKYNRAYQIRMRRPFLLLFPLFRWIRRWRELLPSWRNRAGGGQGRV